MKFNIQISLISISFLLCSLSITIMLLFAFGFTKMIELTVSSSICKSLSFREAFITKDLSFTFYYPSTSPFKTNSYNCGAIRRRVTNI